MNYSMPYDDSALLSGDSRCAPDHCRGLKLFVAGEAGQSPQHSGGSTADLTSRVTELRSATSSSAG